MIRTISDLTLVIATAMVAIFCPYHGFTENKPFTIGVALALVDVT